MKIIHAIALLILSPVIFVGLWLWAVWSLFMIRKHPELADRR